MKKENNAAVLLNGILKENPVLVLILGTCPTLATTNTVDGALGMGLAALAVLVCSNIFISLTRKIVPESIELVVNGWDCPDRTFDEATGKVSYAIKLPLKDGFHTVSIRARDDKGNLLAKEWKFEVR